MDDLISRQAAIDAFRKELCREREYATPFISFNGCKRILNELPSAERRGRWIMRDNDYIDDCKCSECGCVEYFNKGWKHFDYCPMCGARMEVLKYE